MRFDIYSFRQYNTTKQTNLPGGMKVNVTIEGQGKKTKKILEFSIYFFKINNSCS